MSGRIAAGIDALALALGGALLVLLGGIWASHLAYPYDIEWMEGGMLAHAWRVQRGLPLYAPPSSEWVPYVYPPGYSWIVAALAAVVPLDYALGRAVSLAATLVAAGAAGAAVLRVSADRRAALWSGLVFLGAYPASGAFYDLVRPDALFVALAGLAVVLALGDTAIAAVGSGLLLAAALLCKHNAAVLVVPLLGSLLLRREWARAALFCVAFGVPVALAVGWLQQASGGWFLAYLVEVPAAHPLVFTRILPGLPREVGGAFPLALAAMAGTAVLALRPAGPAAILGPVVGGLLFVALGDSVPPAEAQASLGGPLVGVGAGALGVLLVALGVGAVRGQRPPWRIGLLLGAGVTLLLAVGLMRAHNGGFLNVYMPLHWILAVGFGVTLAGWRARGLAVVAASAVAIQLAWQLAILDVRALTPTAADRAAGDRIVEIGRAAPPGPVFSPYAPWIPVRAGREPSLALIGLWDLEYEEGPLRDHARRVHAEIRARHFPLVLDGTRPFGRGIGEAYRLDAPIGLEEGVFMPRTGFPVRPESTWVPR